jgi:predicted membrane-bound spermidine synthase
MTTPEHSRLGLWPYVGIVLISGGVLILEISLTRVLSVTMYYHCAFAVISLAMLGLSASAVGVFVRPRKYTFDRWVRHTTRFSVMAGVCTVVGLAVYLQLPLRIDGPHAALLALVVALALFGPTFLFAGYVIALLLTHHADRASRLYGADLAGAGTGAMVVVAVLNLVPAPWAVALCGLVFVGAGWCFRRAGAARGRNPFIAVSAAGIALVLLLDAANVPLLTVRYVKHAGDRHVEWERWNALARLTVLDDNPLPREVAALGRDRLKALGLEVDEDSLTRPELSKRATRGWGLSRRYDGPLPEQKWLMLDAVAGTGILAYEPGERPPEVLEWDVTAAAYHLRPVKRALIIGGGGGRDALTALRFNVDRATVVEINRDVVDAVQTVYGELSGRPYDHPKVDLHIAEARSFLTSTDARFDLIQMSLIDSFAASMAGAFVLTENNLYTTEAMRLYWDRLTDNGMVSVSRWFGSTLLGESGRMLGLMVRTLQAAGVARPADHIVVVSCKSYLPLSVATLVMTRSPLSAAERTRLAGLCTRMGFEQHWPVAPEADTLGLAELFEPGGLERFSTRAGMDLSPPTDDRPFFFQMNRPFRGVDEKAGGMVDPASPILAGLLVLMGAACVVTVLLPLAVYSARTKAEGAVGRVPVLGPLLFFAGIGVGFLTIEIALMQRYILFLGHPTYATTVVLFSVLLFSGIGSLLTDRFGDSPRVHRYLWLPLVGLLLIVWANLELVPAWLATAQGWSQPWKILVAVTLLGAMGLLMGMPFPTGVKMLRASGRDRVVPWMWGVNGVCSVLASVLAVYLAVYYGYSTALTVGGACYLAVLVVALFGFRAKVPSTAAR